MNKTIKNNLNKDRDFRMELCGIITIFFIAIYGLLALILKSFRNELSSLIVYILLSIASFFLVTFLLLLCLMCVMMINLSKDQKEKIMNLKFFFSRYLTCLKYPYSFYLKIIKYLVISFVTYFVSIFVLYIITFIVLSNTNPEFYNTILEFGNIMANPNLASNEELINIYNTIYENIKFIEPYLFFISSYISIILFFKNINFKFLKCSHPIFASIDVTLLEEAFRLSYKQIKKDYYKNFFKECYLVIISLLIIYPLSYFIFSYFDLFNGDYFFVSITSLLITMIFVIPHLPIKFYFDNEYIKSNKAKIIFKECYNVTITMEHQIDEESKKYDEQGMKFLNNFVKPNLERMKKDLIILSKEDMKKEEKDKNKRDT